MHKKKGQRREIEIDRYIEIERGREKVDKNKKLAKRANERKGRRERE